MNYNLILKIKVVILFFLIVIISASPLLPRNVTNMEINYWVTDALHNDERVAGSKISVATKNNIVTLSGDVDNIAAKRYAVLEAKKIRGVSGVIDKIAVMSIHRSDIDMRKAVGHRLVNSAFIESENIKISCRKGKVTLSGSVASWAEREEGGLLAAEVKGVKEVNNALIINWKEKRSDRQIENDVTAALEWDVYLCGMPIIVTVFDGIVTLEGVVGGLYEKELATRDALWVSHVREVKNLLRVGPLKKEGSRQKKVQPSDISIKKALKALFNQDTRIYSCDIRETVSNGHVILEGSIRNFNNKRIAEQDAHNIWGVREVTNNLKIYSEKSGDEYVRDDIYANFRTDYLLENFDVAVKVKDSIVTLSGEVHTLFQKYHAEDVAARIRGVKNVVNRITISETGSKKYNDTTVARIIRERIRWNSITCPVFGNIMATVKNGTATLIGDVNVRSERIEAGRIAFRTEGISRVDNKLTVQGYKSPSDEWCYKFPHE